VSKKAVHECGEAIVDWIIFVALPQVPRCVARLSSTEYI
jgi:hypothetical protein